MKREHNDRPMEVESCSALRKLNDRLRYFMGSSRRAEQKASTAFYHNNCHSPSSMRMPKYLSRWNGFRWRHCVVSMRIFYNAISSKQLRFWCLSFQAFNGNGWAGGRGWADERTRRIERTKSTVMSCRVQLMVDWRFWAKRWKWCRLNGEWIGWHDSDCNNGVAINRSTALTRVNSCCNRKNSHSGWFGVFCVSFGAKWHER